MKRFVQCICLLLVMATLVAFPAQAAELPIPRASSYFGRVSTYLYHTGGTTFQVWFDVTAVRGMDELGTSEIKIMRSTDNANWTTVKTFTKESYPSMIAEDTAFHGSYVTYTGSRGYYYKARVTIYAKEGNNTAKDTWYTDTFHF